MNIASWRVSSLFVITMSTWGHPEYRTPSRIEHWGHLEYAMRRYASTTSPTKRKTPSIGFLNEMFRVNAIHASTGSA